MSSSDSIEVTAPTVDQAINQALAQLGADQDDVKIEVLSTPRSGVLGLGARQAKVRVTRRAPEGASSGVTSPPPAPPLVRQPPRPSASAPPSRPRVQAPPPVAAPVEEFAAEDDDEIEEIAVAVEEVSIRVSEPSSDDAGESADDRVSADPETLEREATTVLRRILELMGEKAEIETARDSGLENVELNIKGDGSGLLIGRHGQTLDALEYVVNRILARKIREAGTISIDTESYRARRRRQLHRMALSKGEQAKREHVAVMLDPMPPRDRRIVHLALKDDPLVTTRSSGDGFLRSIEIVPVDERREGGGRGGRDRRPRANERERESDRDRPRDRERESEHAPPLGQQGGFKHGQKRIV